MSERFDRAIAAIDAANADDPDTVVVDGRRVPKERAHAELMTRWIDTLVPAASEALRLAARAHHVRRWTWPRRDYPDGRAGYLRWRRDLHDRHAEVAAAILADAGYDAAMIARVGAIMHKRGLGDDPEVQAYEDALCLVFVQTQLADLVARTEPERMARIAQRTLAKMSPSARKVASTIPLGSDAADVLRVALARIDAS